MPSQPARTLIANRYEMIAQLGEGSMGAVYHVLDRLTGSDLALKRVLPTPVTEPDPAITEANSKLLLNLANEFRALATLRHPYIISVLEFGFHVRETGEPVPYFTMPLLDAPETIIKVARGQTLTNQMALVIQTLQALNYLHRRGILHRDLKPGNVLVSGGQLYVLDFGLAVERDAQLREATGTLAYMAPEVLRSQPASEASDQFSVGVMLAEILGGRHPFQIDNVNDLIQDVLVNPLDLSHLDISESLMMVNRRLLARDPDERYSSVEQVIRELCAAVEIDPPQETAVIRESFLQAARFVGRKVEINLLGDALDEIIHPDSGDTGGSAWLIGGESGVGKSRLSEELRTRALVDGALVLRGQAVSEGDLPYQLWRDILRRLTLIVPLHHDEAALLRLIVPDIDRLLLEHVPPSPTIDLRAAHERIVMLIEHMLEQAAAKQPLLLLFEDLQWAPGGESLQVLAQLLPRLSRMPVMIVANYRNDEAPQLPQSLPDARLLQLDRLSEPEIEELSASMLGEAGSRPGVVSLLQHESEGNVFFLIEVARALAEDAGSLGEIGLRTLPQHVFIGGMQRVINRRLSVLPDWARPAINFAAVAGREVDPQLIRHMFPALDYERWLVACVNAAVLMAEDTSLRFAHDKMREGALAALDEAAMCALSQRVAESIEAVYQDDIETYAAILHRHWQAAGNPEREGHFALIAAEQYREKYQYDEAFALLNHILKHELHLHAANPDKMLANTHLQMGLACYGISDYDTARKHNQQALPLYKELEDRAGLADVHAALGEVDFRQGKFERAKVHILQSLDSYLEQNATQKIGYAYMNLGVIEAQSGSIVKARDYFQQSYELLSRTDDQIAIARALNNLGIIYEMLGDCAKSREIHNQSLEIRRRIKDRKGIAYSLFNLAAILEIEGELEQAREMMRESLQIMRVIGERMSSANALANLGLLEATMGATDTGRQYLEESLQIRRDIGDAGGINLSLIGLGNLERDTGNLEAAWDHYREAMQVAQSSQINTRIEGTLMEIGHLLGIAGRPRDAISVLAVVRREFAARSSPTGEIDEKLAQLRARLAPDEAQAALARADDLSLDAAVALALGDDAGKGDRI